MSIKSVYKSFKRLQGRNDILLSDPLRKTEDNHVNLHWWSMHRTDGCENVGDYLSPVVVDYMLGQYGLSLDTPIRGKKHLYAIGSIIDAGVQDAVVWGSGYRIGTVNHPLLYKYFRKLDVRLVRGPETRNILLDLGYNCPELYGDPAIIMPMIYSPNVEKKQDYTVILHIATMRGGDPHCLSPITNDYKKFINELCESKLVISSSLHGIILAESYGIPAVLLSDAETKHMLKYKDYYYSTQRYDFPIAESVEEALNIEPPKLPDLSSLRDNIIRSFPYDLWEK